MSPGIEHDIEVKTETIPFNDDEKPPPSNAAGSTKGLVSIKPVKYFKEDAALVADTVTAEVEINAASSATSREGLDLVVVLDISESMSDEDRIGKMKKAMHFVIMKLTPVDRLSICAFSNVAARYSALLSMTPAGQSSLMALVDNFAAGGGTYIEGGLACGLAVITNRVHTVGRTANIFLMSDGQESIGNARQVDLGDVPVYTFGFGKDTDHQLLSDISNKSPGGTFSSVPDGTNLSLPFSQLLGGLLTIIAQDVKLTITPKTDDGDVGAIVVVPGTGYKHDTDAGTGVITIKFGTLFAGEGRRVIINLELKESTATSEYDAALAEAQHSYTVQGKLQTQAPQDIQILRTPNPTEEPGTSVKARNLQAELARRQHAGAITESRVLADDKKLDDARGKLVDAQNSLEDIMLNDGHKLVDALRAELLQLLKLMETQDLYEAQGRAYALAAEISHARQRYASRGGDADDVRLFSTPRMDTYRKQAEAFEKDSTAPLPSADEDVKEETAANPLASIGAELAVYLQNAIQALQAIEKIISTTTST